MAVGDSNNCGSRMDDASGLRHLPSWSRDEMERLPITTPVSTVTLPETGMSIRDAISDFRLPDNAVAINQALREGTPLGSLEDEWMEPGEEGYYLRIHDTMAIAAQESVTIGSIDTYRGLQATPLTPDQLIDYPCWTSVSVSRETAMEFALHPHSFLPPPEGEVPTLMTLTIPSGIHVINTLKEDVAELILPPGTSIEVLSVEHVEGVQYVKGGTHQPNID